ncbi:Uncharacterised protein [Mycobacteroides abscessus subsp. abscessus]|uniref:hypothetical protein n=1 Tax=Mycobacteroides abscessus TaxID=36809 RepID=UPI000929C99E|nr:hypothetical protein [Mycobacteroides abscessus]SHU27437.1 Uncharacterised protein [Mycobacteroides abscessus subsp. abscessus]
MSESLNLPVTVTVAVVVVTVVLAIAAVFCVALLRALPPDVPRIIEPFSQLCTAIVGWVTGIRFRCPPGDKRDEDDRVGGTS